ncbi:MAG: CDP-glycerol glycerophosphotransferase family protein [Clostridia bacterium]|nr:CDP-glycerol glycerophosphotransferase family protein [Clostridia bacterium]
MSEPKFMVNNLEITNSTIKIDAVASYYRDDIVPKARVIFDNGNEIRRLPLILRNTYKYKAENRYYAIFSYSYNLNYVFSGEKTYDDFGVYFEINFGDVCLERVQLYVSDGIAAKYGVAEKYTAGNEFAGTNVYSSDKKNTNSAPETLYYAQPDLDNNRFIVKSQPNPEFRSTAKSKAFYRVIAFLFTMLYCVLLLPWFVLDGILAGLNVFPSRKSPDTEGLIKIITGQIKANIANFIKANIKDKGLSNALISIRDGYYSRYYARLCKKPVIQNRVSFISGRRDELGGNESFVYELMKDRKDIDFQFLLSTDLDRFTKGGKKKRFYELYATSKVVIVDDYYNLLNTVEKRGNVTLFQLWHACGAFKTFGFSRLGKPDSPRQSSPNHRMYDFTTVSSQGIVKYYAEGFGISDEKVLPTGIPRTDIFLDKDYEARVKESFYSKYPQLKNKKIILFAPTFRGAGQKSAFYPVSAFDPNAFSEKLGEDYAVLIKLHPFCEEKFEIRPENSGRVIDLSEEDEINDLLFVTDILITDYSSCIFEASLLDIPMLFYAYDLYQYISERDFYSDFESFVPGKIVFTEEELGNSIIEGDFESGKIPAFKEKFFSQIDGKSSRRVADKILSVIDSGIAG